MEVEEPAAAAAGGEASASAAAVAAPAAEEPRKGKRVRTQKPEVAALLKKEEAPWKLPGSGMRFDRKGAPLNEQGERLAPEAAAAAEGAGAFGRGARSRKAPTWVVQRDAPEELAPKRFAKTGGVPVGRRKVAGVGSTTQQALQPERILENHLSHWRSVRRHARRQFAASLLRHRARLQELLALQRRVD